jgi:hypothetical protein
MRPLLPVILVLDRKGIVAGLVPRTPRGSFFPIFGWLTDWSLNLITLLNPISPRK